MEDVNIDHGTYRFNNCVLFYQIWIFDQSDGSGRLLRSRSSHNAPPTKIRFYGSNGYNILSAGY